MLTTHPTIASGVVADHRAAAEQRAAEHRLAGGRGRTGRLRGRRFRLPATGAAPVTDTPGAFAVR